MATIDSPDGPVNQPRVTLGLVLSHLRQRDFAVLSTVSDEGDPRSAGVNYGIARPGHDFAIYVMTRRQLKKARNIARNPNESLLVPLTRRFLWFLPPPTIQLRGQSEILERTDEEGTEVFHRFWMERRILEAYEASHRRGETRICFLKITPSPVIMTYMVGYSFSEIRGHVESAAAKVVVHAALEGGQPSLPVAPQSSRDA